MKKMLNVAVTVLVSILCFPYVLYVIFSNQEEKEEYK